jgi:hypothetical protein
MLTGCGMPFVFIVITGMDSGSDVNARIIRKRNVKKVL